jgi:hypothetical protein
MSADDFLSSLFQPPDPEQEARRVESATKLFRQYLAMIRQSLDELEVMALRDELFNSFDGDAPEFIEVLAERHALEDKVMRLYKNVRFIKGQLVHDDI